jgi:hypothetical protein
MVPSSALFDQSVLRQLLDVDPVVQDYRTFFADLDWSLVEQWQAARSTRGRPAHPESAYLKAFLVRIREKMSYTSQLRRFLLNHPLLVIELGFHLELDPSAPYGFDCQRTLRSRAMAARKTAHSRSRPVTSPAGCDRGRFTRSHFRLRRNGGLRCQAHLRLGAREQSQCLRQRRLQCDPPSQR